MVTVSYVSGDKTISVYHTETYTVKVSGCIGGSTAEWDWGDDSKSTTSCSDCETSDCYQSASHYWKSSGTYTVTVTVTDDLGNKATTSWNVTVYSGIQVSLSADETRPYVYETVNFSASISGGSGEYTCQMDYGDGDGASGCSSSYSHYYKEADTFYAQFTATDNNTGDSDSDSVTINVYDRPSVTASADKTVIAVGDTVNFSANTTGGVPPLSYEWDFGDGEKSTEQNPSHQYNSPGKYTAKVTVTDDRGTKTEDSVTIQVYDIQVSCSASPSCTHVDYTVYLSASVSGGSGDYSYLWSTDSTSQNTTTSYGSTGTYNESVVVTDNVTGQQKTCTTNDVTVKGNPTVSITASETEPDTNEDISFSATISYYCSPVTYDWDFGDGSSSSEANPTHSYSTADTYTVSLEITDNAGAKATDSIDITVYDPITASITASTTTAKVGEDITFTVTYSGGKTPYEIPSWDFGDGEYGSGDTVTHSYGSEGTYTVTVTVADARGREAQATIDITVTAVPSPTEITVNAQDEISDQYIKTIKTATTISISVETQNTDQYTKSILSRKSITITVTDETKDIYIKEKSAIIQVASTTEIKDSYVGRAIYKTVIELDANEDIADEYTKSIINPRIVTVNAEYDTSDQYAEQIINKRAITINVDDDLNDQYTKDIIITTVIEIETENKILDTYLKQIIVPSSIGIDVSDETIDSYTEQIFNPIIAQINVEDRIIDSYLKIKSSVIRLSIDNEQKDEYAYSLIEPKTILLSITEKEADEYTHQIINPRIIKLLTQNTVSDAYIYDVIVPTKTQINIGCNILDMYVKLLSTVIKLDINDQVPDQYTENVIAPKTILLGITDKIPDQYTEQIISAVKTSLKIGGEIADHYTYKIINAVKTELNIEDEIPDQYIEQFIAKVLTLYISDEIKDKIGRGRGFGCRSVLLRKIS